MDSRSLTGPFFEVPYNLTQTGWYAVDDGERVILGPFESLALCERAIRDRLQPTTGV